MELSEAVDRLREPPPRAVTPELLRACEPGSRAMLMWGGVALTSVGGGYTLIFSALAAPWQILAGAAATAATGLSLLTAFIVVTRRLRRLLGEGWLVNGEVARVEPPRRNPVQGFGLGRITYTFTAPGGATLTARRPVRWASQPPFEPGDSMPVCTLPDRPRRHLALV